MKAQIIEQFGDPSVFRLTYQPKPTMLPGHALIKVIATSVNPLDCKIRTGIVPVISPAFPAILHGDVAGVIEEVAYDVHDFKVGDEVYGCAGGVKGLPGALAEYMLVDTKLIAKKPKSLTLIEAAALPLVSITAWEALFTKSHLQPGTRLLIQGGAGGVGHVALQLAKWAKAIVHVTVRNNDDVKLTKQLGADEAINIEEHSYENAIDEFTKGRGYDLVFDTIGGSNLENSFKAAGLEKTIVTTVTRGQTDLTQMHNKGLSLHVVFMLLSLLTGQGREQLHQILTKIAEIVDQGKLKPLIHPQRFTLETVAEAHALLESGQANGKVVIEIASAT